MSQPMCSRKSDKLKQIFKSAANVVLLDMFRDNKFVLTVSVDTTCHGLIV
jgi:hypothetical protein